MRETFTTEQKLPYPIDLVFAFFANPENLPRLMPGWQKAKIVEAELRPPPPLPEGSRRFPGMAAGNGSRVLLSFRALPWFPLRLGWDARIENFTWNQGFCDVQLRGPFAYWRHCHTVRAERDATIIRDEVEFTLRADPFSRIVLPIARKQIATIFNFRHQKTAELMPRFAAAVSARATHPS